MYALSHPLHSILEFGNMAASTAQSARSGAKAPKKKATAQLVDRTASPAPSASPAPEKEGSERPESGSHESAYIRELQKYKNSPSTCASRKSQD